jgi:hypothetical protein
MWDAKRQRTAGVTASTVRRGWRIAPAAVLGAAFDFLDGALRYAVGGVCREWRSANVASTGVKSIDLGDERYDWRQM